MNKWCDNCKYYRNNYGYGQCYAQKNAPRVDYNHSCENFKSKAEETERLTGKWIVTAEDTEGVHKIQCPFCGYEKGSDFVDYITVTFERMPPFCENCGAKMKEAENEVNNRDT